MTTIEGAFEQVYCASCKTVIPDGKHECQNVDCECVCVPSDWYTKGDCCTCGDSGKFRNRQADRLFGRPASRSDYHR